MTLTLIISNDHHIDPDATLGAFLIPYAIALATLGLPLFILELAVSHPYS